MTAISERSSSSYGLFPQERHASWKQTGLYLLLFIGSLVWFTQFNNYPYYYHPDEFGKCKQIVKKVRNYNHPLLLLTVAQRALRWSGEMKDYQHAVEVGRFCSAFFASVAVATLAFTAQMLAGRAAALATAAVMITHPLIFEHAHIFKEDAALLMGMSLTLLACVWFWEKPSSRVRLIGLGVAAGLACSAKFVGFIALAPALAVLIFRKRDAAESAPGLRWVFLGGALVLTLLIVNADMLIHFSRFTKSFDRELQYSVGGHRGLVENNTAFYYWQRFQENVPLPGALLTVAYGVGLLLRRQSATLVEWIIFLTPLAFTGMLMTSPKVSERYFLPPAAFFLLTAVLGIGEICRRLPKRSTAWAAFTWLLLTLWLLGAQAPRFTDLWTQLRFDDRRDLRVWMEKNLPAGATVAQDATVNLPDPSQHKQFGLKQAFSLKVRGAEFVADLGTLESLRAQGVRYVAISDKKMYRFISGSYTPLNEAKADYELKRSFYSRVMREGKLLWSRPPLNFDTLHPGLKLYEISPGQ